MTKLNPSMRPKVNGDTFFLPDAEGGVYFRNNSVSFRMEGKTVDQWIERLIPVFNGENTLGELTEGLPDPYRQRVVDIAAILLKNGFVRDVSRDRPHGLPEGVLKTYASQIAFLDGSGGSGAHRFESYRRAKVLAVGSGPFLASLAAALFASGLPRFHVLVTDPVRTNRQRLAELTAHARKTDPGAALEEVPLTEVSSWREAVQPFDAVLYVSREGNVEELRVLHGICREEKKVFLPAVCLQQTGLAGPLVHPDAGGCWESAWRRIHRSVMDKDPQLHTYSSTAGAMLANVIVFEWFKTVTGVTEPGGPHPFYLLDLETLEGSWHSFKPHPLVTGLRAVERVDDPGRLSEGEKGAGDGEENGLLAAFSLLTSAESGIFHVWEEGDLKQLPLAQCRVQAADPTSEGPAELLPERVCTGWTHEEARREAGLAGIESYVSRLARLPAEEGVTGPQEIVGVGAGETVAEGVCRGLQRWLAGEGDKRTADRKPPVVPVRLGAVEDERCRYYLQALRTMRGEPVIGLGEEVSGFPVAWVGTGGRWYGGAGLNRTWALRKALQEALQQTQNEGAHLAAQGWEAPAVQLAAAGTESLAIPACAETAGEDDLRVALQVLKRNGQRLTVFDLALEPFLKEELAGVFGVSLREEGGR